MQFIAMKFQFKAMKLQRLLILGAAAWAGTMFYKLQSAGTETVSGDESKPRSVFSSVNGPGSLGQTVRNSSNARAGGAPPSYPNSVDPVNINRGSRQGDGLLPGNRKHGKSPAVEDMPEDDAGLIQAAAKGDKNIVERKLARGVKVDSRDTLRRTPLMYACWNGFDDISNRLLAAGANPEFKDRDGNNAYDYAASRGLVDSLHFLMQRTKNTDPRYMEYAHIIQALYSGNAAYLPQGDSRLHSVNKLTPDGQGVLHVAAGNGSVELMQTLIRRGADINLINANRQTPLHWAAWNNQPAAAQLLLAHGADVNATDGAKNTPLALAAQNNALDVAKMLLSKNADRYLANQEGKTPSIIAEDKGTPELATLLK